MVGRKGRVTWHRHVMLYFKNLFKFSFHFMSYLCLFNTETITSKVILFSNMIKIDVPQGAM